MKFSISDKITDKFLENGVIAAEDHELYSYGVQQGMVMVLNIFTTVIIGIAFEMLWQSIVFMMAYIPLRSYVGGYHARTQVRCYVSSIILMMGVLLGLRLISWNWISCIIIIIISSITIVFMAPIQDNNKPLSLAERTSYSAKGKRIYLVELFGLLMCLLFHNWNLAGCILIMFLIISLIIWGGAIKNYRIEKQV